MKVKVSVVKVNEVSVCESFVCVAMNVSSDASFITPLLGLLLLLLLLLPVVVALLHAN